MTGGAGFIGHHLCGRLLAEGKQVWMVDRLLPDEGRLRRDRLACHVGHPSFHFLEQDLSAPAATAALFAEAQPEVVVHLAAAVGVRASLEFPDRYVQDNVAAFTQILEGCRRQNLRHLIYA
ncbi:MAG TPA: NAD-dependent epimerase/dehydratase family protein, partial [Myxococcota bacterium]|nr:NAD-dependent epimerase/dehydratase family protein [Myxococcota bacterium]